MSKLVKELDKNKAQQVKSFKEDTLVKEANRLLLDAHSEEREVLGFLNLDHHIKYAERKEAEVNKTRKIEEIYKRPSYTGKELKALCLKYDLRILPTRCYNGSIPVELTRKVLEFTKDIDTTARSGSYFILAPVEQFNTIKHVPINADPILFYLEGSHQGYSGVNKIEEDDVLINVHHWGNDFGIERKFRFLTDSYRRDSDSINYTINLWKKYNLRRLLYLTWTIQ